MYKVGKNLRGKYLIADEHFTCKQQLTWQIKKVAASLDNDIVDDDNDAEMIIVLGRDVIKTFP